MDAAFALQAHRTSSVVISGAWRRRALLRWVIVAILCQLCCLLLLQLKCDALRLQFGKYVLRGSGKEGQDSKSTIFLILLESSAKTAERRMSEPAA